MRIRDTQSRLGEEGTEKTCRFVIIGSLVRDCVGGDVMNKGLWNNGL